MIAGLKLALALWLVTTAVAQANGPETAAAKPQGVINFQIPPPKDSAPTSSGWSFAATLQGQSLDLLHRGAPTTYDDYARPSGATIGFDWRSDHSQILLGYRQSLGRPPPPRVDLGPSDHKTWSSSDIVGLSITIHNH